MSLRGLRGSGDRSRPLTSGLPRLDVSHKRLPAPRVMQSPRPGWCFGDECAFNPACQPDRCMVKKERQQARSATAHSPHLLKVEDRWMQKERGQQMVSQKWHSAQLLKVKRDEAPAGDSSRDQAHGGLKDAGISDRFRKVPRLGRGGEARRESGEWARAVFRDAGQGNSDLAAGCRGQQPGRNFREWHCQEPARAPPHPLRWRSKRLGRPCPLSRPVSRASRQTMAISVSRETPQPAAKACRAAA